MRFIKSRKFRHCKKCRKDITKGALYWPQRNDKAVCVDCAHEPRFKTFLDWLLMKISK